MAPEGGTAAILRALGSLMVALGGDEGRVAPRVVSPPAAEPKRTPDRIAEPAAVRPESEAPSEEAALLLADARERAQRILDESLAHATDLLGRKRSDAGDGGLEMIRRSVNELLTGMSDVQQRLDRIEALLRERPGAWLATPGEERGRGSGFSVVPPAGAPAMRAAASAPPAGIPASAVPPPVRSAAQPVYVPVPPPPPPAPASHEVPPAAPVAPAARSHIAPLATFTPADGSVLLRAAPVSGFQGLMRLQDALVRLPAVRQATVEAYAQGEARLRLDLATAIDSDEIAAGLGQSLGQNAGVLEASEADRTILIVFG